MERKIRSNVWLLLFLFFILPIGLSSILVFGFSEILDLEIIKKIISISGFLFTLSSLILVFVLVNTFKASDYHKSVSEKEYLEEEAIKELIASVRIIKNCIQKNKTQGLSNSSGTITHIYRSLSTYEDDAVLKAYINQIKTLVHLINRHKLSSIGFNKDHKKLKKISVKNRQRIYMAADDLERYLGRV